MALAAHAAGRGRCVPRCGAGALAGRRRGEARGPRGSQRPRGALMGSPGGRSGRARAAGRRVRLDTWPITRIALAREGGLNFLSAIVKKRLNLPRSLYENLQILSLTLCEQMPLHELLAQLDIDKMTPKIVTS